MRHQLKPTPSARARLRYITRQGRYAVGLDGPRDDLRATGSAHLPAWAGGDAERFWSAADGHERANARRCLELELNLPRELNTAQQVVAVQDYLARLTDEAGQMPCTWAIHDAGDGNPHCHLMIQERPLDGHERTAETWFRRANQQQPERGGALKSRWWHDREHVFWSRALWADACNQALIRAGHEARFDHRPKAAQLDEALRAGDLRRAALLSTLTERHEGVAVAGMRRRVERGEVELAELPDYARDLIQQNDRARTYNCALRDWVRTAPEAELREHLAHKLDQLNPSAHVAAWMAYQHAQALDEDCQRDVAAALEAGELAGLIEVEQDDHLGAAVLLGQIDQLAERVLSLGGPAGLGRLRNEALPQWRAGVDCPPLNQLIAMRDRLRDEVLPAVEAARRTLPVIDAGELAELLPRYREQYAALSGDRAGKAEQLEDDDGFDWTAFDEAEAIYDAQEPSSLSRSLDDEREEFERYRERYGWGDEPQWVEFERHGELYGYWDDELTVIYWYDGREWAETDAVPDTAPAPRRPRLG